MIECAVILAVGTASHKSQLVFNRAHAMLPVLGKPLIVRVMNPLHQAGIRRFIVVVGMNEGAVASYLNSQWVPDAEVEFVLKPNNESQAKTLGEIARRYRQPFLLASYNSFSHPRFPEALLKKHQQNPNVLLLSGAANPLSESQRCYYALTSESDVREILREKPADSSALTLMDMAVCGQDFVTYLAETPIQTGSFFFQLMDVAALYLRQKGAIKVARTGWTLQIETDLDLLKLNRLLLDDKQDAHTLSEVHPSVQIVPPVRIDPQVSIGPRARIGPYTYLERGCTVGSDAVIENAIVLQQAAIAPHDHIKDMIVSSRGKIQ